MPLLCNNARDPISEPICAALITVLTDEFTRCRMPATNVPTKVGSLSGINEERNGFKGLLPELAPSLTIPGADPLLVYVGVSYTPESWGPPLSTRRFGGPCLLVSQQQAAIVCSMANEGPSCDLLKRLAGVKFHLGSSSGPFSVVFALRRFPALPSRGKVHPFIPSSPGSQVH